MRPIETFLKPASETELQKLKHCALSLNSPQVAILGGGRIRPAPAVHEGELCIRHLMHLSLTFDHRIVDGAPAAHFL